GGGAWNARATAPRQRQRFGISVRMLMLLVLLFGCWLGGYVRSVRVQQEAVAAIKAVGGTVTYDWEWGNYHPDILDYSGRPRAPKRLARRVGGDFGAHRLLPPPRPRPRTGPNP